MVENILGRVLDAFQAQLAAAVAGSAAGRLAESIPLVRLMAKEPSATLLGSPVAFFVGGNTGGWVQARGAGWQYMGGAMAAGTGCGICCPGRQRPCLGDVRMPWHT
jgi:hypothetical protein